MRKKGGIQRSEGLQLSDFERILVPEVRSSLDSKEGPATIFEIRGLARRIWRYDGRSESERNVARVLLKVLKLFEGMGEPPSQWPCDNFREPQTCITAGINPTSRCTFCHDQTAAVYGQAIQQNRLIDRIREAMSNHPDPTCFKHDEGDAVSCGWKSAYTSMVWAVKDADRGPG